jgi:leucyl aminopeptidase (aminopeptidase T)
MSLDYDAGASNAVRACLNVGSGDRVAVIQDWGRAEIAAAIMREARSAGGEVACWAMEDWVDRPALLFPEALASEITRFRPTASFFIAEGLVGELGFRKPMLELLARQLRCRHGHMIGVDARLMREGMAADYDEVYRVTHRVYDAVREAGRIEVATRLGTELTATFTPLHCWVPSDGRYWEQGRWGNLPEGEVFTAPLSVDGLLVGQEMGDHFAHKYGLFEDPVRLTLKAGRVTAVEMARFPAIQAEIEAYLDQSSESNRAGEFAIGTNVALTEIVGNFLQDEKFPGVHVAFGDPYAAETGADWSAPSHVDVLASRADVWVDGRKIMDDGNFLI